MALRSCRFIVILGLLAGAFAAQAAVIREQVVALAPDRTLTLAQTGKAVFADMLFPDAPLADAWFASHLLQKEIAFTAGDEDRYGRVRITSELQAAMLRDGVAVIFNQQEIPAGWAAAEQAARAAKRGVWGQEDFVLTPENAAQHLLQFHVVEGVVTRVYKARNATYVNFGENWHTDFSVTIAGRNRRSFDEKLARITQGTRVRVRGTLYEENGPMLKLTRPEQLELY